MNGNLISRYIWLVDTLNTYGRLTRDRINDLWVKSHLSDGNPLPERTFYHYRRGVEETFKIDILCNHRGEYYINPESLESNKGFTNWLLDSYAVSNTLSDASDMAQRVEIEEVPSAREFLPPLINALREGLKIRFTYAGFNRSRAERNILFHPYFLKRYKQRWYMLGHKENSNGLRTYALDRIKELEMLPDRFEFPSGLKISDVFGNIVGVTTSKADVRKIRLKVSRTQAKYFRALPLHSSQLEEVTADDYSIFSYRLQLNYELVHEILGLGDAVEVLEPSELQAMVVSELKKTLSIYEKNGKI